jgi:hypothetical protein
VRTLAEAHAATDTHRPRPDADLLEWVAHHRRCARLYEAVARTDPTHGAQAAAWARIERRLAETLEENLLDLYLAYLV